MDAVPVEIMLGQDYEERKREWQALLALLSMSRLGTLDETLSEVLLGLFKWAQQPQPLVLELPASTATETRIERENAVRSAIVSFAKRDSTGKTAEHVVQLAFSKVNGVEQSLSLETVVSMAHSKMATRSMVQLGLHISESEDMEVRRLGCEILAVAAMAGKVNQSSLQASFSALQRCAASDGHGIQALFCKAVEAMVTDRGQESKKEVAEMRRAQNADDFIQTQDIAEAVLAWGGSKNANSDLQDAACKALVALVEAGAVADHVLRGIMHWSDCDSWLRLGALSQLASAGVPGEDDATSLAGLLRENELLVSSNMTVQTILCLSKANIGRETFCAMIIESVGGGADKYARSVRLVTELAKGGVAWGEVVPAILELIEADYAARCELIDATEDHDARSEDSDNPVIVFTQPAVWVLACEAIAHLAIAGISKEGMLDAACYLVYHSDDAKKQESGWLGVEALSRSSAITFSLSEDACGTFEHKHAPTHVRTAACRAATEMAKAGVGLERLLRALQRLLKQGKRDHHAGANLIFIVVHGLAEAGIRYSRDAEIIRELIGEWLGRMDLDPFVSKLCKALFRFEDIAAQHLVADLFGAAASDDGYHHVSKRQSRNILFSLACTNLVGVPALLSLDKHGLPSEFLLSLALRLHLKDYFDCKLLRALHEKIQLPGALWLQIVPYIGLFNMSHLPLSVKPGFLASNSWHGLDIQAVPPRELACLEQPKLQMFAAEDEKDGCSISQQTRYSVSDNVSSVKDADQQQSNADLADALRRSKAEQAIPLSGDGVVLLKLTRRARTPDVQSILLDSQALHSCRQRVIDAGCEIMPAGSCGAKFFVPCTSQQLEDLSDAGFELADHHILCLSSDKKLIEDALQALSRSKRPRVAPAGRSADEGPQSSTDPRTEEADGTGEPDFSPMLEVECSVSTDSDLFFPEWVSAQDIP